jgi:hypothetical protein
MTYLKSKVTERYLLEAKLQEFLLQQHQNTQNTHKTINKQPRGEERNEKT